MLARDKAKNKSKLTLAKSIEQSLVPYENFPRSGFVFRDISPILQNPKLFSEIIEHFSARYSQSKIDAVVALEARGFILGAALAHQLKIPFVMIRKEGKLPGEVHRASYKKFYGVDTFVMQKNALKPGEQVVIIDDFYSSGGSLQAASELVHATGASIYEAGFLINNLDVPTKQIFFFPIYTLFNLNSNIYSKNSIFSSDGKQPPSSQVASQGIIAKL